ncbi:hypothetical protein [Orbus mooreae]|uniref:hypothetical protein n=1 Tax=Orbus mooreae TaxID=3074107 RepID=UPI00370DCC29
MKCRYKGCSAHTNYSSGYCNQHAQIIGYMFKKKRQMDKRRGKFNSMNVVMSEDEHQDPPLLGTSVGGR